jgi:hypothetical protein
MSANNTASSDPTVFTVDVSLNALGLPVCSPDPVVVTAANALLVFKLDAEGHEFPANDAVVVASPGDDFPYACWEINKHTAAIYDAGDDQVTYDYTVTVINSATGERLSVDPAIDNHNTGRI